MRHKFNAIIPDLGAIPIDGLMARARIIHGYSDNDGVEEGKDEHGRGYGMKRDGGDGGGSLTALVSGISNPRRRSVTTSRIIS